ncbi:auxin efflux family transporter [Yoonia sediminilitoris]|uniref:Auxin efflux family transporter n=1 Tax=Yoonia sediminilitoris TaxID=1286148 RepID=A0A2T6KPF2_9RHOB|nr:auxin efflux family transporter [Yoonia sediminilitoris]RCW98605.1 auxin efflux family transporter [Yoonia sediminilitoris]
MNIALTVLNITAPVFILAAIGFVWVKLGFEYRVQFVTRLAMTLSVPCLVFVALMQSKVEPTALATLSFAALAAYAVIMIASFAVVRLMRLDVATFVAPLAFGNTGNLGLPLALFAFGQEGLGLAVVVFAVMAIFPSRLASGSCQAAGRCAAWCRNHWSEQRCLVASFCGRAGRRQFS